MPSPDEYYSDVEPVTKLTDKQLRLVDEYMVDLNKTAAFRRAGFKCSNPEHLAIRVNRLFKNPLIREEIRRRQEQNAEDCKRRSPLDVMLENMTYWYELATKDGEDADLARNARNMAQACARDAAPYVHPKLQAIAMQARVRRSIDDFTDDELAAIALQHSGEPGDDSTDITGSAEG